MSADHAGATFRRPGALSCPASRLPFALLAAAVALIAVRSAWLGDAWQLRGGDYAVWYQPATDALLAGHVQAFFAHIPGNGAGGSVLLRLPFSLLAKLAGGDQLAIFRVGALECLLALSALGLWLALDARRRAVSWPICLGAVALFAGAPLALEAVIFGHPEECLGAALCIGAVLLAGAERPALAGVLLGAALINKPWGVFAVGPVLLCAPAQMRRILLPCGVIVGCWLVGGAALAPSALLASVHGAETSIVAHPQDLWWPLKHMDGLYPVPPAFLSAHARELSVLLALAAAAALAVRARRAHAPIGVRRSLALLALGFALRCLLEPSAHVYYQLPLVAALAAWELRARRSIVISLTATILLRLDFGRLNELTSLVPFAVYLAVLVPICAMLLGDLLGDLAPSSPIAPGRLPGRARRGARRAGPVATRAPARRPRGLRA